MGEMCQHPPMLTNTSPAVSHCQPSPGPCSGFVSTTHSWPAVSPRSPHWEPHTQTPSMPKRQLCSAVQQQQESSWPEQGKDIQSSTDASVSQVMPHGFCLLRDSTSPAHIYCSGCGSANPHADSPSAFHPSHLGSPKGKQTTSVPSPAGIMARNTRQRNALADIILVSTLCPTALKTSWHGLRACIFPSAAARAPQLAVNNTHIVVSAAHLGAAFHYTKVLKICEQQQKAAPFP